MIKIRMDAGAAASPDAEIMHKINNNVDSKRTMLRNILITFDLCK